MLKEMPFTAHLFFSHVHWDHIQGFPFFWPAFVEGNDLTIYAGRDLDRELESVLAGQMEYAYFPVRLEDMHAADLSHCHPGEYDNHRHFERELE